MKRNTLTLTAQFAAPDARPSYPWLHADTEVLCRLKNTGSVPITLQTWSCSWYESWETDSKKATVPVWGCDKNVPVKIVLKPSETYEKAVPLQIRGLLRREKHLVRLTFVSGKERVTAQPVLLQLP